MVMEKVLPPVDLYHVEHMLVDLKIDPTRKTNLFNAQGNTKPLDLGTSKVESLLSGTSRLCNQWRQR